jgi:chaperonin GroES
MAKCDYGEKDYPWKGASNVHYPLLTQAVMQFNARAYPAIVKGDAAVNVKVVGADSGLPVMGPDGQPVMQVQGLPVLMSPQGPIVLTPQGPAPLPEGAQPQPAWQREPGAKVRRANRVRDYMNFVLFYRMDNWEGETDTLLMQMPAIGCAFRKVWFDGEKHNSRFVPALKLIVNNDAHSLMDAPQIAEEIDGVFPHQIKRGIKAGDYRPIHLDPEEKDARTLIEAQCYCDLDEDGLEEPYIVTVDHKTREVLRIVPDFDETGIEFKDDGSVLAIERRTYYVKYEFLPHPEGKFYNIGLAHLLDQYGEVINTIVNQMIDANHAATAGGGFVASGLRIQGQGQSSTLSFRPGEYKTVPVQGGALRDGLVERTLPNLSPVMFQLLELIFRIADVKSQNRGLL